jgi:UDP-glucose/iron transport system ATP-binding protein
MRVIGHLLEAAPAVAGADPTSPAARPPPNPAAAGPCAPDAGPRRMLLSVRDLRRLHLAASFELGAGECLALRGPSGSGKTQLLRAVADLDPNEGTVLLEGRPRDAMPAPAWRRLVGYVAAEAGWWADTVGDHFPDWTTAAPLAGRLGLPPACRGWPVQRLSTGERQRLALARALVAAQGGPRVLLLDEPTAGLDGAAAAAVEALVAERRAGGTGVVWVTHDAAQAGRVARRRLLLRDGRLEEAARPP